VDVYAIITVTRESTGREHIRAQSTAQRHARHDNTSDQMPIAARHTFIHSFIETGPTDEQTNGRQTHTAKYKGELTRSAVQCCEVRLLC